MFNQNFNQAPRHVSLSSTVPTWSDCLPVYCVCFSFVSLNLSASFDKPCTCITPCHSLTEVYATHGAQRHGERTTATQDSCDPQCTFQLNATSCFPSLFSVNARTSPSIITHLRNSTLILKISFHSDPCVSQPKTSPLIRITLHSWFLHIQTKHSPGQ